LLVPFGVGVGAWRMSGAIYKVPLGESTDTFELDADATLEAWGFGK
jgi:hypothetical protein